MPNGRQQANFDARSISRSRVARPVPGFLHASGFGCDQDMAVHEDLRVALNFLSSAAIKSCEHGKEGKGLMGLKILLLERYPLRSHSHVIINRLLTLSAPSTIFSCDS